MSHYKLKGTSGSVINQSFPFSESIVLGTAGDCAVQLGDPAVDARHAEIRLLDSGALVLRDLGSSSGTLLNGEPVDEAPLAAGDEIRVGTCRLMLQAPGLRPARVLTGEVVHKRRRWPRVLVWTALAAAAAAVAVIKFKPEWLELLRSLL